MNTISAVFQWASAHPYLATGMIVAGGYGVYKLSNRGIDAAEGIAHHGIDVVEGTARHGIGAVENAAGRAIEKGYSFEAPQAAVKAYPLYQNRLAEAQPS